MNGIRARTLALSPLRQLPPPRNLTPMMAIFVSTRPTFKALYAVNLRILEDLVPRIHSAKNVTTWAW